MVPDEGVCILTQAPPQHVTEVTKDLTEQIHRQDESKTYPVTYPIEIFW